jgi:hypothetical protein
VCAGVHRCVCVRLGGYVRQGPRACSDLRSNEIKIMVKESGDTHDVEHDIVLPAMLHCAALRERPSDCVAASATVSSSSSIRA